MFLLAVTEEDSPLKSYKLISTIHTIISEITVFGQVSIANTISYQVPDKCVTFWHRIRFNLVTDLLIRHKFEQRNVNSRMLSSSPTLLRHTYTNTRLKNLINAFRNIQGYFPIGHDQTNDKQRMNVFNNFAFIVSCQMSKCNEMQWESGRKRAREWLCLSQSCPIQSWEGLKGNTNSSLDAVFLQHFVEKLNLVFVCSFVLFVFWHSCIETHTLWHIKGEHIRRTQRNRTKAKHNSIFES